MKSINTTFDNGVSYTDIYEAQKELDVSMERFRTAVNALGSEITFRVDEKRGLVAYAGVVKHEAARITDIMAEFTKICDKLAEQEEEDE